MSPHPPSVAQRPGRGPREDRVLAVALAAAALVLMLGEQAASPKGNLSETGRASAGEAVPAGSPQTALPPPEAGGERLAGHVLGPDGRGLAGALVQIEREATEHGHRRQVRTDAQGAFAFEGLPPGRWTVLASAPGHAARAEVHDLPAIAPIALTLAPVARIAGQVFAADGSFAAGADVVIAGSGVWPARAVRAGEDGCFAFDGVPPGIYEVRARRGDETAEPRRGLSVEGGARVWLTFHLAPGETLVGVVLDAEREAPIAGAEILVLEESIGVAPRALRSGADGSFRVPGLRPMVHRVTVHAQGFTPVIAREWQPGTRLRIELEPGAVIAGVVVDERRRPIEGARIEVIGEGGDRQPIAIDGVSTALRAAVFRAHEGASGPAAAPASWRGGPSSPGALASLGALEVTTGDVPPIPLEPLAPVEPVAPTLVADAAAAALPPTIVAQGLRSAADGSFRVAGVPAGWVQVVARADGYALGSTERIWVAPRGERRNVEIVLSRAGRIDGTVALADGEPVARALIEHRSDAEPWPRVVVADEEGRFAIENVSGAVTLRVPRPSGDAVQVRLDVGPGEVAQARLVLPPPGPTLAGRVLDERRRPVARAQVRVESMAPGGAPPRLAITGDDGRFEVEDAPPAPYRIWASHVDYAEGPPLDVESARGPVEIMLREGGEVTGSVVDRMRLEPIEGAEIVLEQAAGTPLVRTARTDAEGAFALPRVAPGVWRVRIAAPQYACAERTIEVTPQGVDLRVIDLQPAATLEGDVVDSLGHVVRGAQITIDEHQGGPSARTDARGHFVLAGIAPGTWTVRASHPAAGEVEREIIVRAHRNPASIVFHLPARDDPERAATERALVRGVAAEVEERGGAVRIARLPPGSAAARAGLREGDIVRAIDGTPVEGAQDAERLLRGAESIDAVLELERDGSTFRLRVPRQLW
jgi:protocatechuate 3,4-dioxygenase beta subunit